MTSQGHDSGHAWRELVHAWRERMGGWTALAEELVRRGGERAELPNNLETIERGLRRLASRENAPGGQYGRWIVRYFGVPLDLASYLRWLGQYHSRFADLPVSLRRRQLEIWDRPPVSETAAGVWVDLGVASVGFRNGDQRVLKARLDVARRKLERAPVAAVLEHALLRARIDDPDGHWLATAGEYLDDPDLDADDEACYRARFLDATAYPTMRSGGSFDDGRALYASIPEATGIPFVDFRRSLGIAYCTWKSGESGDALQWAREAAGHAGDGGFVRFRVMALNLASRIADGDVARRFEERARRLSLRLEDEELLGRVRKPRQDE